MKLSPYSPLLLTACVALLSCSKAPEQTAGQEAGGGIVIGAIPKSTGGEFWVTVEAGARRAAAELGVQLKWEGTVTETEIAEQTKIIENMINLGVDGLAVAPLNRQAQRKPIQTAANNGIPVVIFDSAVEGSAHKSFVATDNNKGGELAGQFLAESLPDNARVMVLRYVQGTASTEERSAGFISAARAGGLEIVADPYSETGTLEGSKNVAANTFERFIADGKLTIDGIFAANLYSTLGVASALDDLRKGGIAVDVRFVGFDSSRKLVEELQAGNLQALVVQNPEKMGYLAIATTYKVIKGEPVEPVIDTGVELVTTERLKDDAAARKLVGLE